MISDMSMVPPSPSPGPITAPTPPFQTQQYQDESPLYVFKSREATTEIDQQRFHDESLQWFGEECVVRLLWRAEDAAAGLVTYCLQCQDSPNPVTPNVVIQQRASNVYKTTGNSFCPNCYGTTFTGGFQPTAYHLYMLAADTPEVRSNQRTGQFWKENPQVQFSWFPQIRTGDLVIRIEQWNGDTPTLSSTRFQVSAVNVVSVRTGPSPSMPPTWRTGNQPYTDTTKIISQHCTLEALWPTDQIKPGHPYYQVPFV